VRYLSLQVLRAVAAVAVVVYHAQLICHKYASRPSSTEALLGEFGSYGVDLFFVLSGFVILYTIHNTNSSPAGFLTRRLIRIVPLYWVLSLGMVILGVALYPRNPMEPRTLLESLLFCAYVFHSRPPLIYVGWSIEYEIFFYAVVTLTLAAALPVYRAVGLLFLTLYVGLHLLAPAAAAAPGNFGYFLGNPLLFEFVLGLLLAKLAVGGRMRLLDGAIVLAAIGSSIAMEGVSRLVFAGVPAAVLVWSAVKTERWTSRYRVMQPLARIGDASYSIYLVQVMALPAVGKLVARFVPGLPPDLLVLTAVVSVVAAGILLYRGIERPLLKMLQAALIPVAGAVRA
jgi:exopolysaccharide production protein ExoZ